MRTTTAITVGQTDTEYATMKAGYFLAFYELQGHCDTLPGWIGQALHTHAARSSSQRHDLHVPFERRPDARIKPRRYNVPADAVAAMRAVAGRDRAATDGGTTVLSESAWARDAIAAAVADVAAAVQGRGITLRPMAAPLPRGRLRR